MKRSHFESQSDGLEGGMNTQRAKKLESRDGKPKYYCALSARYKVGDIIHGTSMNSGVARPSVFLTTDERPHFTLRDRDNVKDLIVYRVIPISKIKPGYEWAELSSTMVEVVEVVGSAAAFVERGDYGHVNLRSEANQARDLEDRSAEYYHNKNIQNPNTEGADLLEKIYKKYAK